MWQFVLGTQEGLRNPARRHSHCSFSCSYDNHAEYDDTQKARSLVSKLCSVPQFSLVNWARLPTQLQEQCFQSCNFYILLPKIWLSPLHTQDKQNFSTSFYSISQPHFTSFATSIFCWFLIVFPFSWAFLFSPSFFLPLKVRVSKAHFWNLLSFLFINFLSLYYF